MKTMMLSMMLSGLLCSGCMATVSPSGTVYARYWETPVEPVVVVENTPPVIVSHASPVFSVPIVLGYHRSKPAPLVVRHSHHRPHAVKPPHVAPHKPAPGGHSSHSIKPAHSSGQHGSHVSSHKSSGTQSKSHSHGGGGKR